MPDRPYKAILEEADAFFGRQLLEQPGNLQCGKGCSLCCYGLFEIGAGDVATIADGLAALHPMRRAKIIRKALETIESTGHPDLRDGDPEEKAAFFERAGAVPCPVLDESGACMMYDHRPLVCRTFGLPLREGPAYIGDICELNFTAATQEQKEAAAWDLLREDVAGPDEEYTVPEAIVLAARARGWI